MGDIEKIQVNALIDRYVMQVKQPQNSHRTAITIISHIIILSQRKDLLGRATEGRTICLLRGEGVILKQQLSKRVSRKKDVLWRKNNMHTHTLRKTLPWEVKD